MIEIINPFILYLLCLLGGLGFFWTIKFSGKKYLGRIVPKNNFRFYIGLIIASNVLLFAYLFIDSVFIFHMLVEPGYLESNTGSGGGYYWADNLTGWNQETLSEFKFYKALKELMFTTIMIANFIFAIYLRKKNPSQKLSAPNTKPSIYITFLLLIVAVLTSYISYGALLLTIENNVIWEGG